ncbi:MAG TPA: tetratricopeptide repeat protein [Blastocatellia bacterium]|nr:tetratricopeptide repeat protein [Blastocatellia bacterium]
MNRAGFISSHLAAALAICLALIAPINAQQTSSAAGTGTSVNVKTSPGTTIWLDGLRYGNVPASGELTIRNLRGGTHSLRARLKGKQEVTQTVTLITGTQRAIRIPLAVPAGEAELHFQNAEESRERADHAAAIEEYRQAIKLHGGSYSAARVGLARSLMAKEEYEDAIAEARRAVHDARKPFPEAQTVIANTKRAQGLYDEALAGYRTALLQAHDFSPEAHTGVALTYEELNQSENAIKHFRIAAAQSNGTEPVIYFLLGGLLQHEQRTKEAIEAYENYLKLEPQGKSAGAVRSLLTQLRRELQ